MLAAGELSIIAARYARAMLAAGALLLVHGCAAPLDRHLLQYETVRLEGARGTLSRERSRQIIEDLKKRSPDSAVLERHIAIEEALTENPLSVGNRVTTLEDGPATYAAMLSAIKAARHHVHFEVYIFEGDEVGKQFASALKERAQAGVKVRLIYDALGSHETPREFFKDMADNGVEVAVFSPISVANVLKEGLAVQNRDHRKLTIVDGRIAFVGGINISGVYTTARAAALSRRTSDSAAPGTRGRLGGGDIPALQRPWRDLHVRIDGPVVADLQRAFVKQWEKWSKQSIDGKELFPQLNSEGPLLVRAIAASPGGEGVNALYVALISAIRNAESKVSITNAYFVPHPDLREALCEAAQRGVDVKLLLPGESDNAMVYHAGRAYYRELLDHGVKIYERKSRMLHAKSATIDGVWSTVGSTNLDWRSLVYNDELNAIVLGPDFAGQISEIFDRDLANSEQITVESWSRRPFSDRIKELSARAWARIL